MKSLINLQAEFFATILNLDKETPATVLASKKLDAHQRMQIYRDAYRFRLIEALMDNFPALHTITGDDLFENICLAYIGSFPSEHFSIRYFGQHMANFLASHQGFKQTALLAELALFEWALRDAFDGPDAKTLDLENLKNVSPQDWPNLVFTLKPTFKQISLYCNAPQLWKAAIQEENPVEVQQTNPATNWIIWRPELETKFRSVNPLELFALEQLVAKNNFATICEALTDYGVDDASQTIAGLLMRWIEDGLLTSAHLRNQTGCN